jgi:CheY-like chemotaxis protein
MIPSPAQSSAVRGTKVLVVDDDQDAAELLAEALGLLECETRVAHDGERALVLARSFRPEVAFLDLELPVMDGRELAARLRADPAMAGLKLIALTGYAPPADPVRSAFDQYVVKPLDIGRLTELLSQATSERPRAI